MLRPNTAMHFIILTIYTRNTYIKNHLVVKHNRFIIHQYAQFGPMNDKRMIQ